jgi:hypothetical protein
VTGKEDFPGTSFNTKGILQGSFRYKIEGEYYGWELLICQISLKYWQNYVNKNYS